MITECFIKGRYDFGVGKCAVVIVDDAPRGEVQELLHKAAWKVPDRWQYNGETVDADQFNCEILAAIYALNWCKDNGKGLVNIFSNLTTCQKWYYRLIFPADREAMAQAYVNAVDAFYDAMNKTGTVDDRIYADYIKKSDSNPYNILVNELAEKVK